MSKSAVIVLAASIACSVAIDANSAQRTFVASNGDDGALCNVTAPCRSFATALLHTDPDGEIIVLDSAGYGAVTISQSVSIIAPPGVYAGISVFSTSPNNGTGIFIDGGTVVLRGLSINGQGGQYGTFVFGAPQVYIEHCVVSGMTINGIEIARDLASPKVVIRDTTVRSNAAYGIYVSGPTTEVSISDSRIERSGGSGVFLHEGIASLDRVRSEGHGGDGVQIAGPGTLVVRQSVISGNGVHGVDAAPVAAGTVMATVTDSTISGNGQSAIRASAAGVLNAVRMSVARSAISGNGSGIYTHASSLAIVAVEATDNVLSRNTSFGLSVDATGATIVASRNSITGNATGVLQVDPGIVYTRSDNTIEQNTVDVTGTTVSVLGK